MTKIKQMTVLLTQAIRWNDYAMQLRSYRLLI